MLLGNADCLKHIGFQLLFSFAGVQHQKSDKEHPLVLALQLLQQCLGIPAVSRQIRRKHVHIISGADGFFLLLNLGPIEFGNGVLDGFDGLVLVNGLDVHGDNLAGIHVQKILQQLVAQVRSRDIQKADRPEDESNLKTLPKIKELDAEYSKLLTEKKARYPDYRKARDEMQELLQAQKNIELFFDEEKDPKQTEHSR